MSRTWNLDGVFAVHKPGGISSADVLRDLQRHFNPSEFFKPVLEAERQRRREEPRNQLRRRRDKRIQVKLGHGGTLDPIATGVLITGVGKGTKQLNNFLACTKSYEAVVLFGAATDTYDRVGKVVSRAPYEHVTREKVEEALKGFRGKIMQRPSIFSALKVQGKKLYEYAREGKEPPVEIAERPVEVSNLEIVEWYEPGTHSWTWPTEEAGGAEKDIATKLITKEKNIIETEQNHVSEENDLKRKAPPESAHGQDEPPAPKRQKE
ncbi:pseudouridine synthase pus4, partial [Ophidiomyces ophidiicola]